MIHSCKTCLEDISDNPVEFGQDAYHSTCFVCCECLGSLLNAPVFDNEHGIFCEYDYAMNFGHRCVRCADLIKDDKFISALGFKWHLDHFICENCGKPLAGQPYSTRANRAYCSACEKISKQRELEEQGPVCSLCKRGIKQDDQATIRGKQVHAYHYNCCLCRNTLKSDCKEFENQLYCGNCFRKISSSICASCKKPIVGRSMNALGKLWHPEHFTCSMCEKVLDQSFLHHEGKAYCEQHYNTVKGETCLRCGELPTGNKVITALQRRWCDGHFVCFGCDRNLTSTTIKFTEWDTKPMCSICYDDLPFEIRRRYNAYLDIEKKATEKKRQT